MQTGGEISQPPLHGGQAIVAIRQIGEGEAAINSDPEALNQHKLIAIRVRIRAVRNCPDSMPSEQSHLHRPVGIGPGHLTADQAGGYRTAGTEYELVCAGDGIALVVAQFSLQSEYIDPIRLVGFVGSDDEPPAPSE